MRISGSAGWNNCTDRIMCALMSVEPREPPKAVPDPKPEPNQSSAPAPVENPSELTPDEQMARFEQELKETDWGHQPC